MPLLEDLRLAGASDYVMYPLPFLDQTRTAVISFATQQPQGFDPASLEGLEFATKLLSPYLERHVLRRIAVDLLDTYVGPRTGQRIIEGRVDRGAAEMIEAAIWFADLRGFTLMSEQSPIPEVLANLNAWFRRTRFASRPFPPTAMAGRSARPRAIPAQSTRCTCWTTGPSIGPATRAA
jgi:adenylate cyclase